LDYLRRAQDAFPKQVLNEFLPLTIFHLRHHNRHSRKRVINAFAFENKMQNKKQHYVA
jgi:hypothetical protein